MPQTRDPDLGRLEGGIVRLRGFTLSGHGRSMLSEFGPLWGTKSVQRLRDPHASVTFPSEDARIRVDPPERLTPGRLVATTACSGRHETPGTGPPPAAGAAL